MKTKAGSFWEDAFTQPLSSAMNSALPLATHMGEPAP
jgi:hypothetical protein